ncbi:effector-associated constant component EACC1 [Streptomyces endophyticus]|uniref:Uncharacterized protein n=1 Tax=Streptomyces endophyticus TaxID=714166 RepID=A0ABU6F8I2_9ACTN|nr:hypothetical protein [Streptomyces endophyticus]MEB8339166.1 hypothetical protein [Streptomyces endophyticus]
MEIRFSAPQGEAGEVGDKELRLLRDWLEEDDQLRSAGVRIEGAYQDRPGAMGDLLEWFGVACGAASLAIEVTHSVRGWWRSRGHEGELTFVVRGEDVERIGGLLRDIGLREGGRADEGDDGDPR